MDNELIRLLRQLEEIHLDRIEIFQRALRETHDLENDLRAHFDQVTNDSRHYLSELVVRRESLGDDTPRSTTVTGMRLVWMDVRSGLAADNRMAVLKNVLPMEEAAEKAYREALRYPALPGEIRSLIGRQELSVRQSLDLIRERMEEQRNVEHFPLND
jgi:uncharacterized protein (TIGR02284 family)